MDLGVTKVGRAGVNQVVEDLKATRDIVAERWCPKGMEDGENVCIMGALNTVTYGTVRPVVMPHIDTIEVRRMAAYQALMKHLDTSRFDGIARFNDDDATQHRDVLNLIDKTLADLGGMA